MNHKFYKKQKPIYEEGKGKKKKKNQQQLALSKIQIPDIFTSSVTLKFQTML